MDHVPTEPHDTQHVPHYSIPMGHVSTEPHDTQHVPAHSAIPGYGTIEESFRTLYSLTLLLRHNVNTPHPNALRGSCRSLSLPVTQSHCGISGILLGV